MERLLKHRAALIFASAAVLCGVAPAARALDVGPKDLPLTVAGVPVQIPVAGSIDARSEADAISLTASASGDLSAIQDHALAIARGLRLPHDPCAHKNFNIVVDSVDAAAITPRGKTAVVDLSGHVAVWLCKKVLGTLLKTEIAADRISISVPVELYLPNPRSVGLRLSGPATLRASDPATAEAASAFADDLNGLLTAQLAKLLDAARARAVAPAMPGLDVTIDDAAFVEDGPKLTVRAHGRASMTSAAFASFLAFAGR
ncbi:MAG: hypothetical protein ACLQE9_08085 [Roseiarcus sp.]